MNRKLAIVPAHNEAGAIGPTVAEIRRWAPDFDVLVVDDGSTDATAGALRGGRPGTRAAVQPRHRRRDADRLPVRPRARLRGGRAGRRRRPARPALHPATCCDACRPIPSSNMVTGSRFLDADSEGYRSSAARRVGIRVFSTRGIADHRAGA